MQEQDEASLLDECPACGYLLRGLPVEHACPECGMQLNRRCKVFGGRWADKRREGWPRTRRVLLLAAAAVLLYHAIIGVTFIGSSWGVNCIFFGAALLLFHRAICQSSRFVVVGPYGVDMCKAGRRIARYEWSQIGQAYFVHDGFLLAIQVDGKRVRVPLRYLDWSVAEAHRCRQAINNSTYRNRGDSNTGPD